MKRFPALLALCIAATSFAATTPAAAQDLALTHVNIVDVERGGVHADQTVLIRGNRIAWTGPAAQARIPAGARRVDATGRYAIPGLWDMHVHTSREGRAAHFWPQFLAYGVTGVREMGSYLDSLQYWRARAGRGTRAAGPPGAPGEGARLRTAGVVGAGLERIRHPLLPLAGRPADERLDRLSPHRRRPGAAGG